MTALAERNVLPGAVRGIVGGMPVVRRHGVPKGAPCGPEASLVSIHRTVQETRRIYQLNECALTTPTWPRWRTGCCGGLLRAGEGMQDNSQVHEEVLEVTTQNERRYVLFDCGSKPKKASKVPATFRGVS